MSRTILTIIQLLFYYLVEAFFIGVIFYMGWISIGIKFFNIELTYFNCVFIVWLFKLLRFDLLGFSSRNIIIEKEDFVKKENSNDVDKLNFT